MFQKSIKLINANCGGEIGDVIVSGIDKVIGSTILEQSKYLFENKSMPQAFQYLIKADNIILTPHVAGWTIESKEKLAQTIVDKIKDRFC